MKGYEIRCDVVGCTASIENGDAFHRVNAKGVIPAVWRCTKHFRELGREPDDIAVLIEKANKKGLLGDGTV